MPSLISIWIEWKWRYIEQILGTLPGRRWLVKRNRRGWRGDFFYALSGKKECLLIDV
jgi:hypothetical protein